MKQRQGYTDCMFLGFLNEFFDFFVVFSVFFVVYRRRDTTCMGDTLSGLQDIRLLKSVSGFTLSVLQEAVTVTLLSVVKKGQG